MSLDRRLREGLDRLAEEVEPNIEGRLRATLERGHRPWLAAFALPVLAAAAGVLLVAVVGSALSVMLRDDIGPPIGASQAPSPSTQSVVGTYSATVAAGEPAVQEHSLTGAWTVEFVANGSLSVTAPTSFTGTRTGYSYVLNGEELVTDLFGSDVCTTLLPGTYRWERMDDTVTFTAIDEPCAGRAALLAGQPWQASAGE
jgi:hypothetical protein